MSERPAVGIDLGTTYSAIAALGESGVQLVPNEQRELLTPSVVELPLAGGMIVGTAARRAAALDPDRVFALFKRQMGTDASYRVDGKQVTPVDLSAAVLGQLRRDAATATGVAIEEATVTVPAYFGNDARIATQEAAARAGLDVRDLVHEPTAAAVAFGVGRSGGSGAVLVYDLGGGTFDVTVVRFTDAAMTVLSTCGDHHLGGADWDAEIAALVAERFERRHGVDPRDEPYAGADLQERAESAKRALSQLDQTAVAVVCGDARDRVIVTRQELEERTRPLLARTEWLVTQALEDAQLRPTELDAVLLVGGSTRMPMCAAALERATGRAPAKGVDPDQAVVRGAAMLASIRRAARSGIGARSAGGAIAQLPQVRDVTAHALGFVVVSADGTRYVNEVMIARNAPIPAAASKCHRLASSRGSGPGTLSVYMLQGEAERPLDTQPLGCWTFDDVPAGRKSFVEVEVSYHYDEEGVVQVAAAADGRPLSAPKIDREDRDLRWTEEDPSARHEIDIAVALVIDISESMRGAKLDEAVDASLGFIDELERAGAQGRIAVVSFGNRARAIVHMGDTPKQARRAVKALAVDGSTNMAAGLDVAAGELSAGAARRVVVLLTDGEPNDRSPTLDVRNRLVEGGVELITRGVAGADSAFLAKLSTGDGELVGAGELAGNFRGIARQLMQSGALGLRR